MFTDPIMLKGNAVLSVRQYASNIKLNPKGFFITTNKSFIKCPGTNISALIDSDGSTGNERLDVATPPRQYIQLAIDMEEDAPMKPVITAPKNVKLRRCDRVLSITAQTLLGSGPRPMRYRFELQCDTHETLSLLQLVARRRDKSAIVDFCHCHSTWTGVDSGK